LRFTSWEIPTNHVLGERGFDPYLKPHLEELAFRNQVFGSAVYR